MKKAFLFPGQGAQYIGMGKDFYEQKPESKEIFDISSRILGFDMAKLCFEKNEDLNKTQYTQVAIMTVCISILKEIEKRGITADITAGLSLGEYTALVANGTLTFEEAVKLVRKRGCIMENEVPKGIGSMAAILGLEVKRIEQVCKEISKEKGNQVEIANYNCPGQIVISGEKSAILEANKRLKEAGARRTIELNVSGPFHSSMLKGAGKKLETALMETEIHKMKIPYISNVTAEIITDQTDHNQIKNLLGRQVYSSVKWQQSMEKLIGYGVDTLIEIGPGKTLSGFLKKIDQTVSVINIERVEDLGKLEMLY